MIKYFTWHFECEVKYGLIIIRDQIVEILKTTQWIDVTTMCALSREKETIKNVTFFALEHNFELMFNPLKYFFSIQPIEIFSLCFQL